MQNTIQKFITENCQYLSETDIFQMNKSDNGPINNVLTGLNKHCYGIWLLDDKTDNNYLLFYINNRTELSGLVCRFKINDKKRNDFTLGFAKVINQEYPKDTDLIETFNTFQNHTRTMLEKLNRFTYGNEIADKSGTLIVKNNDVEVGRIVESPSSESATLESDLFEISLGIPPIPNYSDK